MGLHEHLPHMCVCVCVCESLVLGLCRKEEKRRLPDALASDAQSSL